MSTLELRILRYREVKNFTKLSADEYPEQGFKLRWVALGPTMLSPRPELPLTPALYPALPSYLLGVGLNLPIPQKPLSLTTAPLPAHPEE